MTILAVDQVVMPDYAIYQGDACELIRAEALVPLAGTTSQTSGLLALGQRRGQGFETRQGSELLLFLGAVLMRSVDRWLTP